MKKNKINGLIGTLVLHILLLALLYLTVVSKPIQQEEGGVPVMMGSLDLAQGSADPYTLTDVDVLSEPEPISPVQPEMAEPDIVPDVKAETELITQEEEPSVEVKKEETPKEEPKKEATKKKEIPKKKKTVKPVVTPVKKPKEPTEAQKKAEAERVEAQKKAEAARLEAQKREAAKKAAANQIAAAFGKGSKMGSKGTAQQGKGIQGRADGNAVNGGMKGAGGYGSFDLNGRSLGQGGLPRPVYNVQEEGKVVVTIVVSPAGMVISTRIHKNTNTASPKLRKAAEEAAKKARFNQVDGVNNQTGTITYYFKLN